MEAKSMSKPTLHQHKQQHLQRQGRRSSWQVTAAAMVAPTVTRWHPAARIAGWMLLALTVTTLGVFGLA